MSNIDQVIQRARQPGGFSEQQQFTVARERAIRKMREFALADPHYYILELIQATVANGGNHVHIEVDDTTLQFSYVGGGYAREELAQLFDFLFASKEDIEHSDIRQLALGINALMIMEPDRIVVESGDGTLESTDRIEIRGDQDTVEVGTPNEALRGTFVRAEGLDRSLIRDKSGLSRRSYGPPECAAIEARCLAAPVPIIVNNEPVFGYSSQRTPVVFGYDDVVTFDEGDLYGSIGVPEHRHKQSFKLMTFGVWIESSDAALMDETKIGGVVCYDRLNKTADHSGIVRDERFEEMWARIRPYARQVAEGKSGRGNYRIQRLSGEEIPSSELREFFRSDDTFVVVPEHVSPERAQGEVAAQIGEALQAPVLRVDRDALDSVSVLAGSDSALLEPDLDAPGDLEFYRRDAASEPDRPWLTGAVELDPIDVESLAETLVAEESVAESAKSRLIDRLGTRVPIRGTVYTPAEAEQTRELYVRLVTVGRVAWEGPVQSPFPGHLLDVELPAVAPSDLLEHAHGDATMAELLARVVSRKAVDKLRSATRRALENLTMREEGLPSDTGRRIALAALGRSALKRLRGSSDDEHQPDVRFSLVRPQPGPDLLELKVFQALDGTSYSLRDLADLMAETSGLVYGVVPQVEPALDGLDTARILELDLEHERQLLTIVGEAAYVRIDRRDVLAESGPFQVRDMAIGLRSYPEFPLLVEGGDPSRLEESKREQITRELVEQLERAHADSELDAALRREAVRHLQWFVCRRTRLEPDAPTYGVEELPLFLDGEGRPASFESVVAGLQSDEGVEMIDGRSSDVCELGSVTGADEVERRTVRQLTMNTWVHRLLEAHGRVRGAFDFAFSDGATEEAESNVAETFLVDREIDADRLEGRVGIPLESVEQPAVAVVDADRSHTYRMLRPAVDYGLTGFVHVGQGSVESHWDEIRSILAEKGTELLETLIEEIGETDSGSARFERIVEILFGFAARQLQLSRNPNGTVAAHVESPLAQKILELPLFPTETGNPVSALRVVREFCAEQSGADSGWRVRLAADLPKALQTWIDRHLTPSNIVEPAGRTAVAAAETDPTASIGHRLETWLHRLRPDGAPGTADEAPPDSEGPRRRPPRGADGPPVESREWTLGEDGSRSRSSEPTGDSNRPPRDVRTEVRVLSPEEAENLGAGVTFDEGACCRYVSADVSVLLVNAEHRLVQRAAQPSNSRAFAWLLLRCYAHINDLLEPVTNQHELEFQRRVADSLSAL